MNRLPGHASSAAMDALHGGPNNDICNSSDSHIKSQSHSHIDAGQAPRFPSAVRPCGDVGVGRAAPTPSVDATFFAKWNADSQDPGWTTTPIVDRVTWPIPAENTVLDNTSTRRLTTPGLKQARLGGLDVLPRPLQSIQSGFINHSGPLSPSMGAANMALDSPPPIHRFYPMTQSALTSMAAAGVVSKLDASLSQSDRGNAFKTAVMTGNRSRPRSPDHPASPPVVGPPTPPAPLPAPLMNNALRPGYTVLDTPRNEAMQSSPSPSPMAGHKIEVEHQKVPKPPAWLQCLKDSSEWSALLNYHRRLRGDWIDPCSGLAFGNRSVSPRSESTLRDR